PLLPVTTTTGIVNRLRQKRASAPSAGSGSSTAMRLPAMPVARPFSTSAAAAPSRSACATKSWPSKRSPFNATNKSPGMSPRVSVVTRAKGTDAPMTRPPRRPRPPRYSSFVPPTRERGRNAGSIEKCPALAVLFLIVLMTFPRHYDDVSIARVRQRAFDRRCAIERHRPFGRRKPKALDDVVCDRARILAARIVAGDDDAIGQAPRDGAHWCALAAIA